MRNFKLTIAYDGTNYAGWQVQCSPQSTSHSFETAQADHSPKTIQGTIERTLAQILKRNVTLVASGRTDSGVHAIGQVANFKTKSKLQAANIQNALNSCLPKDIVVKKVKEVGLDFHARYSATSKSYRYTILNRKVRSSLDRYYATFIPYPLNIQSMQGAAGHLVGRHDFRSFQARGSQRGSTRTIKRLSVKKRGSFIHIDIEANGFLYNMARNIAGTLIEVGRGKLKPGDIKKILKARKRSLAGPTAPPEGLCLVKVRY